MTIYVGCMDHQWFVVGRRPRRIRRLLEAQCDVRIANVGETSGTAFMTTHPALYRFRRGRVEGSDCTLVADGNTGRYEFRWSKLQVLGPWVPR